VRVDRRAPKRYPWWQLILLGLVAMVEALFRPLGRMWRSEDPLDTYGLAHFGSVAGDAMVAIALAESVFFKIPVGQAGPRVAAFLALTIAPLAVAGPFLVPLLDRAGPRRAISFGAAIGRAVVCLYAAPRFGTLLLFPAAFLLLVLSRVHSITKTGLAVAYAGPNEGLVRANARLGRIGTGGAVLAAGPAFALLRLGEAEAVLYGAAVVYGVAALLNLRLPHPQVTGGQAEVTKRGAIPQLTAPAIGAAGLRAASGFLLFALAFALRRSGEPTWWFALLAGAATAGAFLGDVIAPRLPDRGGRRRDAVVLRVRARGARAVRDDRRRLVRARAAGIPDADAAARARRFVRAGVCPLRDPVPARVGRRRADPGARADRFPRGVLDPGRAVPRRDHRLPDPGHPRAPAWMRSRRRVR
jgi:hypothetical protein